jgi:hypothetical protein
MLFAVSWVPRSGLDEDREKRTLKLFSSWKPPEGIDFLGFYDYADGNGGISIMETSSAELVLESTAPWTAYFEFTVRPIVPTEKSVPIFQKALGWRDSIP